MLAWSLWLEVIAREERLLLLPMLGDRQTCELCLGGLGAVWRGAWIVAMHAVAWRRARSRALSVLLQLLAASSATSCVSPCSACPSWRPSGARVSLCGCRVSRALWASPSVACSSWGASCPSCMSSTSAWNASASCISAVPCLGSGTFGCSSGASRTTRRVFRVSPCLSETPAATTSISGSASRSCTCGSSWRGGGAAAAKSLWVVRGACRFKGRLGVGTRCGSCSNPYPKVSIRCLGLRAAIEINVGVAGCLAGCVSDSGSGCCAACWAGCRDGDRSGCSAACGTGGPAACLADFLSGC